jgi:hypothetical protein
MREHYDFTKMKGKKSLRQIFEATCHYAEHYLKEYESTLPDTRLKMTPERHDGVNKYN